MAVPFDELFPSRLSRVRLVAHIILDLFEQQMNAKLSNCA